MKGGGSALKLDRRHAVARPQRLSGWLLRGLKTSGITLLSPYQTPWTFSSFIQIVALRANDHETSTPRKFTLEGDR